MTPTIGAESANLILSISMETANAKIDKPVRKFITATARVNFSGLLIACPLRFLTDATSFFIPNT